MEFGLTPQVLVSGQHAPLPFQENKPHVWATKYSAGGENYSEIYILIYISANSTLQGINKIEFEEGTPLRINIYLSNDNLAQHRRLVLFSLKGISKLLDGMPPVGADARDLKMTVYKEGGNDPMWLGEVTIVFDDPDDERAGGGDSQV